jgi:hypothetical protein
LRVDPDNRLVADVLEAEWNNRLRQLNEAQQQAEQHRHASRQLQEAEQVAIRALAQDLPALWQNGRVSDRERKRLVRLLIRDVTLTKQENEIRLDVRFRGGATTTLQIPLPLSAAQTKHTEPEIIQAIERLLADYTDGEVAAELNRLGKRSYEGKPFHRLMITSLRHTHGLTDHYSRLRNRGLLTEAELAKHLAVCSDTIPRWCKQGLLRRERANDKNEWLYYLPTEPLPAKWSHKAKATKLVAQTPHGGAV